ncbi:hypothetical protein SLEP1_g49407 [Rubroshorea leprosula]|uniref:Uncharacterized protein n=1 Tax=Rubroshorea leprosula TaxID=152421 RepID=A0AAV5LXI6_9ROSI|nr:hypothetical protein SLEP1_g49407 [Rubroshorea leprosula]
MSFPCSLPPASSPLLGPVCSWKILVCGSSSKSQFTPLIAEIIHLNYAPCAVRKFCRKRDEFWQ